MNYQAEVRPSILQAPAWIIAGPSPQPFDQQLWEATGQVVYNPAAKIIVYRSLAYEAALHVPTEKLDEIPWEERPANIALRGPGVLRLRWACRLNVGQSAL